MHIIIALLLLSSAVLFGLGISLPLVHFQKLYFFNETPSLIGLFWELLTEGSWIIALVILLFSVLFPLIKLIMVFVSVIAPDTQLARSPLTKWAGVLSKWSMMDVLLVALVIFAAKSSGLADAFAQPGLWCYGASAIMGATAAGVIKRTQQFTETSSEENAPSKAQMI